MWNLNQSYWGDWEQFRARTWQAYLEQDLARFLGVQQQKQLFDDELAPDSLTDAIAGLLGRWAPWGLHRIDVERRDAAARTAEPRPRPRSCWRGKVALLGGDVRDVWRRFSDERRDRGCRSHSMFQRTTVRLRR